MQKARVFLCVCEDASIGVSLVKRYLPFLLLLRRTRCMDEIFGFGSLLGPGSHFLLHFSLRMSYSWKDSVDVYLAT